MNLANLIDVICDTEVYCRENGSVRILVLENGFVRAQVTQVPHSGETVGFITAEATTGILFAEAMNWMLDCFPDDGCQEEIEDCSPIELMSAVERYYDGGVAEFLRAMHPGLMVPQGGHSVSL